MKMCFDPKKIRSSVFIIAAAASAVLVFSGCEKDERETDDLTKSVDAVSETGGMFVQNGIVVENSILSGAADQSIPVVISIDKDEQTGPEDETGSEEGQGDDEAADKDASADADVDSSENSGEKSEDSGSDGDAEQKSEEVLAADLTGDKNQIGLDGSWQYAGNSKINSGAAVLYRAPGNRKGIVIGVNAGHGTKGGTSVKTYCHPDMTPKVTGGSTASGSITATAVSSGMTFADGAREADVTLKTSEKLRDRLLAEGYDVLMLRDGPDVQLDNIARTVIANNVSSCMISLHWDGDGLGYDKGCFYISTPDGIKNMEPVASHWQEHERLGEALVAGLSEQGCKIYQKGKMAIDLTQTCYSTIPSVDIELGNQASAHDDATLSTLAEGLVKGIKRLY